MRCMLRDKGIDVKEPAIAPYRMKQLSVRDPDGYGLCFQWKARTDTGPVDAALLPKV